MTQSEQGYDRMTPRCRAAAFLRCPVCASPGSITGDGKTFRCSGAKPHSFDFSASGYLNLSRNQKNSGDDPEMVRARSAFLNRGYYRPLADRVDELLRASGANVILDAGCGEGYYSNRFASSGRTVIGADLSKAAIDHAAKAARASGSGAFFTVASLFTLPVADACADAVVNLFAPCAGKEFDRVLGPGGELIVVGAGPDHLMGLKQILYRTPYQNPGRFDLPTEMTLIGRERLTYPVVIEGRETIAALFAMTPYFFRTSREDHERLLSLDSMETVLDFDIFRYRKEMLS